MEIGDKIKDLRKEKKMSQTDLGKILNTSQDTISLWEKNISKPDIDTVKELCVLFNITSDYLLGLEDEGGTKISISKKF
ncbi:MAG: helix-turn-helix domain-containing protein [Clostridiales bacterium]|jgi:transcriptional regulator with XRE-family HTH domain|nr:helix-turn-helix domain-containing protein [Clostridiales bacterium]